MEKKEITLKNTKAEILEALNEALEIEKELQKSNIEKESMQNKLDQAYNQIKEMATKTVEATGGVKILGNSATETNK